METEFSRIRFRMAAISVKSCFVALSESAGATYLPSRTALDAGVFAVYPKVRNRAPLHRGLLLRVCSASHGPH
jgi:hypothetical protein